MVDEKHTFGDKAIQLSLGDFNPVDWCYLREPIFDEVSEFIDLKDLESWIVHEDSDVLVINKPGWVVCHPSKNGPFSSLVGACRERLQLETLHLISRLDRETSGLIVLAKHRKSARILQMAIQERRVKKVYFALLKGVLMTPEWVNGPLARDMDTPVYVKQTVRKSHSAVSAKTYFEPLKVANGFTLAKVLPITGRKHQIRAHAEFLKMPIVGDKIYGGRPELFLEFAEKGWTTTLASYLDMRRQALQACALTFYEGAIDESSVIYHFEVPLAWDMKEFCKHRMDVVV